MLYSYNVQAVNCERAYVIGVQAVDYSPHYNFIEAEQPNFFGDFVNWLSAKTGCQFRIKALPIKRLSAEYEQNDTIDFLYPDNPNWHSKKVKDSKQRSYSSPITTALGGTMVTKANQELAIEDFTNLAFPRGFTPVAWFPLQKEYPIKFTETVNAVAALKMLVTNRVDGADIEYNVAQHLMKTNNFNSLVLAKNLPYTPTMFYISTLNEHELLDQFSMVINTHHKEVIQLKADLNIIEYLD